MRLDLNSYDWFLYHFPALHERSELAWALAHREMMPSAAAAETTDHRMFARFCVLLHL
jgi:hypothetical protein